MNVGIRRLLIEQARHPLGRPLEYGEVMRTAGLRHSDPGDRKTNAKMLGEISAYEHSQGRPLLSAIVTYKDSNEHGGGFYEVASEILGKTVSSLKRRDFALMELLAVQKYWKDEANYRQFLDVEEHAPTQVEEQDLNLLPFFTDEELNHYHTFAGTHYDKDSPEDIRQREWLKEVIIPKVRYWAEQVKDQFGQEKITTRRQAQIGDTFKEYIWAGLQRPQDAESGIFFTVDCQGKEGFLKIRLGYDFSDQTNLSPEQRRLAEEQLATEDSTLRLRPSEIARGWEELIERTNAFIRERMEDYRRVVALMGGAGNIIEEQVEATDDAPIDPTGSGQDFEALAQRRHDIGTKGEEFVLALLQKEHPEAEVNLMPNGSRFDIKINFTTGKCTEVEVKTTSSLDENADFFISQYELAYAKQTDNEYVLIRVIGIDEDAPKIAYRLTKDQLLARERWVTGYRVSGRSRTINKDDA